MILLFSFFTKAVAVLDLTLLILFVYFDKINMQIFIILHVLFVLVVYFINKFIIKDRRYLPFHIAFFLPGIGMLMLSMIDLFVKKELVSNQIVEYEKYIQFIENKVQRASVNVKKEVDILSGTDELLYSNTKRKKDLVVKMLTEKRKEKVKILKKSLDDEDTEVKHYASSILLSFEEEYDTKLFNLRKLYSKHKEKKYLYDLLNVYFDYINSNLINDETLELYVDEYLILAKEYFSNFGVECQLFLNIMDVNLMVNRNRTAEGFIDKMYEQFPENTNMHMIKMKIKFRLKKYVEVTKLAIHAKKSEMKFSKKKLEQINFWLTVNKF
ncbi:MAG: hypothetical protein COA82_04400 [Alkaliphilus sp.]|nr:hypothetical protein [bacterium AH-315-L21]PHS35489.1 MAG: hypothetical protein COA82_04400 [Alkaliphilus sp.]